VKAVKVLKVVLLLFQPYVEITLSLNNETQIRAALIFAEGIFQGECHVVHPKIDFMQSKISVPLMPPKNVVVDLHIKVYVGYNDSEHFHVFEMTRQLPKFAMFALCKDSKPDEVSSWVKLPIQERPARVSGQIYHKKEFKKNDISC
jgi:Bardet-Biedl syndrome 2 protein